MRHQRNLRNIGVGTFVDPRQQGGKLNEVTKEDLIKLVEFDNKEYLYYKAIAPDIAFIRATTCDSEGYATFEDEVMYLDALVIAQAVHNIHQITRNTDRFRMQRGFLNHFL
ncbi:CoA-transferase, partial [Escherichia sp. TWPC-MK]